MEHSEQVDQLAAALVKAQAVMGGAKKDSANPFFKSTYADLESVWDACREPLTSNGLAVVQTTDREDAGVVVVTTLLHNSGQWMRGRLTVRPVKDDPQGVGSCITYARRYALAAIVGVYQTDDDAEAAHGRGAGGTKAARRPSGAAASTPAAPAKSAPGCITEAQAKRLYVRAKAAGHTAEALKAWLATHYQIAHLVDIPRELYDAIVLRVDNVTPLTEPVPGLKTEDEVPWDTAEGAS